METIIIANLNAEKSKDIFNEYFSLLPLIMQQPREDNEFFCTVTYDVMMLRHFHMNTKRVQRTNVSNNHKQAD